MKKLILLLLLLLPSFVNATCPTDGTCVAWKVHYQGSFNTIGQSLISGGTCARPWIVDGSSAYLNGGYYTTIYKYDITPYIWHEDIKSWGGTQSYPYGYSYTVSMGTDDHESKFLPWLAQHGIPLETHPSVYLPDGCEKCVEEKEAKILECNGESNIINWSDDTCTGECKPCSQDGEIQQDVLEQECSELGFGVLFYDPESCYGVCDHICNEDTKQATIEKCGQLEVDWSTWSDVGCNALCKGCTEKEYNEAIADCESSGGTLDIASYNCQALPDKGIDTDYVCKGSETTIYPRPNLGPAENPETPPTPETPDDPSDDPNIGPANDPNDTNPDTNPNLAEEYLAKLKENSDKQITASNNRDSLLSNIAKNLETSVTNQGILNDNLGETFNSVKDSMEDQYKQLVGIQEELEDIQYKYDAPGHNYSEFPEESLLQGEVTELAENMGTIKDDLSSVLGVDLQGASGLPSWTIPTPFGEYLWDLNQFSFVFDAMGYVVMFAAYLIGAIIIFG